MEAESWEPRPVPDGATRLVRVVLHGFDDIPAEPLLVAWDDSREAVRRATGELGWQRDGDLQAFPREGRVVVQDLRTHPYPRGNRFMDALVVRSLLDLVETVNAEEVTAVDPDGVIHVHGTEDDSHARLVRDEETGVVLRASGRQGRAEPWSFEVDDVRLVAGDALLVAADVPATDLEG